MTQLSTPLQSFPLKAPVPDKTSASDAREIVLSFHESFSSRVKYAAEAAVGTFLLKGVVRQLKQCVDIGRACPDDTWIRVLKAYKTLHCCLLTEAKEPQRVMFINK